MPDGKETSLNARYSPKGLWHAQSNIHLDEGGNPPTIMGETGVRHVMKSLLADFDILMCVRGFKTVEEIDANCLETYPKIYSLPKNSNL
ncbi:hypothetical protein V1522DRAFT_433124 [Lipomyces starkeyi]